MTINYVKGDLLQITKKASTRPIVLAHSCNCLGSWGGGIAYTLKQKFPSSYSLYSQYCNKFRSSPEKLLGLSLVIPISETDPGFVKGVGESVLIACLFTSFGGGGSHNAKEEILQNTKKCLEDLNYEHISMPKINAGIFGVPWKETEKVLKQTNSSYTVYVI